MFYVGLVWLIFGIFALMAGLIGVYMTIEEYFQFKYLQIRTSSVILISVLLFLGSGSLYSGVNLVFK